MESSELTPKLLIEIDESLDNLSKSNDDEKRKALINYLESIVAVTEGSTDDDIMNNLFSKRISSQNRRFTAICLLRLFSLKGFTFDIDKLLSLKVYQLFDEVFKNDIYKKLKVDGSMQTFKKESILKDAVSIAERELSSPIISLTNLSELKTFREKFMRSLGNDFTRSLIIPFLPRTLIDNTRIKNLLGTLDEYLESKASKKAKTLEKAKKANRIINEYRNEAQNFGTYYSNKFLIKLSDQLDYLLQEDLNSWEGSKPASLIVKTSGKKYPFHEQNRDILLGFTINNEGKGFAFDVIVTTKCMIDNVEIINNYQHLGRLETGAFDFKVPARVVKTNEDFTFISIKIEWKNYDGSHKQKDFEFDLIGQKRDLDWSTIELEEPYSLEPVETEDELIGREKIIKDLIRQSRAKNVGSSYIFGQKRVGKTSIAKSLKKLMKPDTYLIAYLEGGEFISPDPIVTVNKLGTKLCQRIQAADLKLKNIPVPDFEEGAISPLVDFLDSVTDQINECKVIFILDEFDELPVQLFKRGPFGDSFFLTMRSLSGKSPFGFILVGGEKMEFIMSVQGDAINKFRAMRVDYFDRQNYWSDFQTLVRKPVENWFDISDKAINTLYSQTAGNPFYTKYICSNVFNLMVERRDSHITITEVNEAIDISIKEISSNSFQHFWEDGIFETSGDRVEEISIRRRKILLVLADLYRKDKPTDKEAITNHEILQVYSNEEVVNELNQFVRRQILIENKNYYEIKVGLLKLWLIKKGISEIMTTFSDYDSILKRKQIEEKSYVKSQEIIDAISSWGLYRGEKIGEERVRSWLNQFGENSKQRLMLTILKNVNFYTANRIREKMREAQGIVDREIKIVKSSRKRKRSDIIVSYIDKIGKSGGGIYAKLYADENNIYVDNIIEKDKIPSFLKNNSGTSALVFVDDFIGTGGSAKSYFTSMKDGLKKALINSGTKCYFITISGFQESKQELEILLERNKLPVTVHICDPIDDSFKCFSQNSRIFQDNDERNYAKSICYEFGSKIIKENFLGFGDCQTTIVFENNCPNNNLPILWAESEDPPWRPIFKRS